VAAPPGTLPVILGLWEERGVPVLVAFDARRRIGETTRKSMFVKLAQLDSAVDSGWAMDVSASGEHIYCFKPDLLPAYIDMLAFDVELPVDDVVGVIGASGLNEPERTASAVERARRSTTALIRSASFRKDVLEAYDGFCALCGLDSGLVQGAHVYPASAPGSKDEVWNGVALCSNHHVAFDKHLIWVNPRDRSVRLHDQLLAASQENAACRGFFAGTFEQLAAPTRGPKLKPQMLKRRYEHFGGRYDW